MIKAIETQYAGCRFRSRLEARWAVAFDHLKIDWRYEPQGFDLPSGMYLPDFYLPKHGWDVHTINRTSGIWVEIKGRTATTQEWTLARELQRQALEPVYVLSGDIPRAHHFTCGVRPALLGDVWSNGSLDRACILHGNVDGALTAARSARFEHGERG